MRLQASTSTWQTDRQTAKQLNYISSTTSTSNLHHCDSYAAGACLVGGGVGEEVRADGGHERLVLRGRRLEHLMRRARSHQRHKQVRNPHEQPAKHREGRLEPVVRFVSEPVQ